MLGEAIGQALGYRFVIKIVTGIFIGCCLLLNKFCHWAEAGSGITETRKAHTAAEAEIMDFGPDPESSGILLELEFIDHEDNRVTATRTVYASTKNYEAVFNEEGEPHLDFIPIYFNRSNPQRLLFEREYPGPNLRPFAAVLVVAAVIGGGILLLRAWVNAPMKAHS